MQRPHATLTRCLVALFAILYALAPSAWAMEHYTDRLTDSKGNSIKGALVYVYQAGTVTLATLYADNGITTKPNPLTTSTAVETAGAFDFYAANGAYDLVFSKEGYTFDALLTRRITLFDPAAGVNGVCINAQAGTTYTVVAGDRGCLVTFSNAATVTVTIPQAGTVGFETGFYFYVLNLGAGQVDLVPVTSTIQGDFDLTLNAGQSTQIVSDGTNFFHSPGIGSQATPTLDQVFDVGKVIDGANSEANCFKVGSASRYYCIFDDPTDGLMFKPSPLADTVIRAWTNQRVLFKDVENTCDALIWDPDAASPNAAWQFGCTASKPLISFLLPLEPRGAATSAAESIVTNQPKQWYLTVTDANTDAVDFEFPVTAKMAGATTATFRLVGVSKHATPSGNIDLDCAMSSYTPGTDTFAAHVTTGEVTALLTPATQNRPVAVTTAAHTINGGALVAGDVVYGSCEVDATATTSAQMTDFRLLGNVLVTLSVNSLSD